MPAKGGGAGGGGRGGTSGGSRGMRSMGVHGSPRGRAPARKPVGAREVGQVRAYGQQQRYSITAPRHVASHAMPPESPWVQWWRQNPDLLARTRGLLGTYGGSTRIGTGGWAGALHPGVAPARRRLH